MRDPVLDLLLPCYQPQPGWVDRVLHAYRILAARLGVAPGVILVNDGSSYGVTAEDLRRLEEAIPGWQYHVNERNRGKGYTLRKAALLSSAPYQIYTDIDFPYTEDSVMAIWQSLQSGVQVAAGVKNEQYYNQVPVLRRGISRLLRAMSATLLRMPISDTQCGLKGFDRKGREVFLTTTIERYLFDLEFLFLAFRKCRLRVEAVPVELKPGIQFSRMRLPVLLEEGRNFLMIWFKSLAS